jgi:hypothetical protein
MQERLRLLLNRSHAGELTDAEQRELSGVRKYRTFSHYAQREDAIGLNSALS